ncbi:hypothetical protein SADUNF_Sadunf14G0027500 [Salix dunnii]|uniref:Uncharacterized protein n=1 Tax=Salix dunnii TaxID=1413687 RepID=A0A835JFF0_9ROSI|nr:hypothetical protein SADUNF_Sadunf14G0027500 [Salix dunnii]
MGTVVVPKCRRCGALLDSCFPFPLPLPSLSHSWKRSADIEAPPSGVGLEGLKAIDAAAKAAAVSAARSAQGWRSSILKVVPRSGHVLGFYRSKARALSVYLAMASTFVTVPTARPFLSVVPQADRVLIRLDDLPEKSSGGVLLPKSAVKFERYLMGEVLSVGAEAGEVEAGKKVLFSDINAYEASGITVWKTCMSHVYSLSAPLLDETLQIDLGTDAKHCFCKAGDLLAVVE